MKRKNRIGTGSKALLCLMMAWGTSSSLSADIVSATESAAEVKMTEALSDAKTFNVNQRNGQGQTPLHLAVKKGKKDIVEVLLQKGADVNAADTEGKTPLHYAVFYGHYEIAKQLLQHHANPSLTDKAGETPLHLYLEKVGNKQGHPRDTNLILLLTP